MLGFIKGGGWVLILALAALGWFAREIHLAGDRREAEIMADSAEVGWERLVDSTNNAWAARKEAWDSLQAAQDSAIAAKGAKASVDSVRASATARGLRARLGKLEDSLTTLTAEDVADISAGLDELETAIASCSDALGDCKEARDSSVSRIYDIESQLTQSSGLNRQQALTIKGLRDLGRPSIGTMGYVGWVVAAGEAALLILQALGGQ